MDFQPTAQPLVAGAGWSRITGWIGGLGRAGGDAGGRCKPVPGGLAAASIPRTPPPSPPTRPLTHSGGSARHGKKKRRAGAKAKAAFRVAAGWTNPYPTSIRQISSTQGVDLPRRPRSTPTHRHRETVEGGEVWVGRTVGAMDGAIEPPGVRALCLRSTASQAPERTAASGWAGPRKGGLRRVLPVHTALPNQQKTRAALALALAVALASSRCRAQPCRPTLPAHENDFTVFSKPSSLRHASTILRSSMRPRATHAKKRPPIA